MGSINGVLDFYDDSGRFLSGLLGGKEPPELLKSAVDMTKVASRRPEDYALVAETPSGTVYKYPIVDPGNALISGIYLDQFGDQLSPDMRKTASAKLVAALEEFGFSATEQMTKTASVIDLFEEDTSLESIFGGTNDAFEVIEDAFNGCTPRGRRKLMVQVKQASVEHPSYMADYARDEIGTDLEYAITIRRRMISEDANAALDAVLEKSAGASPEALAENLEAFDIDQGLTGFYYKSIPDAYQSVFGTTLEKVASASATIDIDGASFSGEDISDWLDRGGNATIKEAFGEEMAEQVAADPLTVVRSLPAPHRQAIARMMHGN